MTRHHFKLQQTFAYFLTLGVLTFLSADLHSVDIQRMPWPISSEYSEEAPTISWDGTIMVFASNRPEGRGTYDLYESRWQNGQWSTPQPLSSINTRFYEGYATLSPDGNLLYFSSNRHREDPRHKDLDIYVSVRNSSGLFTTPQKVNAWNSDAFDAKVTLSQNLKTAWFASSRKGGKGGSDIYVSVQEKAGWSRPVPVSGEINTEHDELNPLVTLGGEYLFFSSNRPGGKGGYDFYVSSRESESSSWRKPDPVSLPINDSKNQIFFYVASHPDLFYFAAGKADEEHVFHIDALPLSIHNTVYVHGKIVEDTTKRPLANQPVFFQNLNPSVHPSGFRFPNRIEFQTNSRGEYSAYLPVDNTWILSIDSPALDTVRKVLNLKGFDQKSVNLDFNLNPRKEDKSGLAMFDSEKAEINELLLAELDTRANELKYSKGIIYLFGYVDYVESRERANRGLGYKRAEAVRKHFIERGIAEERVRIAGQGIAGNAQSRFNPEKLSRARIVTIRLVDQES